MKGIELSSRAYVPSSGDTQALRVHTTSGAQDIYALVNLSPNLADVWVRCHVKWLSDLPGDLLQGAEVVGIGDATAIGDADAFAIYGDSGAAKLLTLYDTNRPFATVALDTWYMVDLRFVKGSPRSTELWVDDVDQNVTVSGNQTQDATDVGFGLLYPGGWETDHELLLCNLKIGTTRGGTEVWTTSLADLSDFDVTQAGDGVLEVVSVTGP